MLHSVTCLGKPCAPSTRCRRCCLLCCQRARVAAALSTVLRGAPLAVLPCVLQRAGEPGSAEVQRRVQQEEEAESESQGQGQGRGSRGAPCGGAPLPGRARRRRARRSAAACCRRGLCAAAGWRRAGSRPSGGPAAGAAGGESQAFHREAAAGTGAAGRGRRGRGWQGSDCAAAGPSCSGAVDRKQPCRQRCRDAERGLRQVPPRLLSASARRPCCLSLLPAACACR